MCSVCTGACTINNMVRAMKMGSALLYCRMIYRPGHHRELQEGLWQNWLESGLVV